jgi:hypothetical protein
MTFVAPKPYVSIAELARLTPWTERAIRTMVARGTLRLGTHYFQPSGRRGQLIFSWEAVVKYIREGTAGHDPSPGVGIDLDAIRAKAQSLLG